MKNSSLCRIVALAALALLSAWPSSAEDRAVRIPVGGACAAVYVECGPGARFSYQSCACVPETSFRGGSYCPAVECASGERMNRTTCSCMPDDRGFHGYEKFGSDLRDSVNSGNQGSAAAMLAARFDGLASGAGASAPAVAAYAGVPSAAGSAKPGFVALGRNTRTQGAKFVTAGLSSEVLAEAQRRAEAAARAAEEALRRNAERDQTAESKEKYGGCRMKGTCGK
jgi:hypothetical protein